MTDKKPKKKLGDSPLFKILFVGEDSLLHYAAYEILVPGLKVLVRGVADSVTQAGLNQINNKLGTHVTVAQVKQTTQNNGAIDYGAKYRRTAPLANSTQTKVHDNMAISVKSIGALKYPTHEFAMDILKQVEEYIDAYGQISIGSACDIIQTYVDINEDMFFPTTDYARPRVPHGYASWQRYGWVTMASAHIVNTENGYMIVWPSILCLD